MSKNSAGTSSPTESASTSARKLDHSSQAMPRSCVLLGAGGAAQPEQVGDARHGEQEAALEAGQRAFARTTKPLASWTSMSSKTRRQSCGSRTPGREAVGDRRVGQRAGRVAGRSVVQLGGEIARLDAHLGCPPPHGRNLRPRASARMSRHLATGQGQMSTVRAAHHRRHLPATAVGKVADLVVVTQHVGEPGRRAAAQGDEQALVQLLQRGRVEARAMIGSGRRPSPVVVADPRRCSWRRCSSAEPSRRPAGQSPRPAPAGPARPGHRARTAPAPARRPRCGRQPSGAYAGGRRRPGRRPSGSGRARSEGADQAVAAVVQVAAAAPCASSA